MFLRHKDPRSELLSPLCTFFSHSQYFRETILNEIRKARELYTGMELAAELSRIQQRLDNVECLSVDIVINLLLTYRDIQVRRLCVASLNISVLFSCVKPSVLPLGELDTLAHWWRGVPVVASCGFTEGNRLVGSRFYRFSMCVGQKQNSLNQLTNETVKQTLSFPANAETAHPHYYASSCFASQRS